MSRPILRSSGRQRLTAYSFLAGVALCFTLVALVRSPSDSAGAQALSGCPRQDVDTQGWARGRTIKYRFTLASDGTTRFSDEAKRQMVEAFDAWDDENDFNCTGVSFVQTFGDDEQIQVVPMLFTGEVGVRLGNVSGTKLLSVADIEIDVTLAEASLPNFYKRAVLHEVGHTLGWRMRRPRRWPAER